jgi:hypothetical protein
MHFHICRLGIRYTQWRDAMPDYEIRYFHAEGSLALVRMCHHDSEEEAREDARLHQQDYASFELRAGDGSLLEGRSTSDAQK